MSTTTNINPSPVISVESTTRFIASKCSTDANPFDPMPRLPIEITNVGRNDLARWFCELGFRAGVEIGVESGEYSEILCKSNPGLHLFSIDPWKAYKGYRDHVNQEKIDGFYKRASERLAPYGATLIKKFSLDAVKEFADQSLDFVYIDGNHNILNVIQDLYYWTPKVKFGGIIAGHDYVVHRPPTGMHVVEGVNAWVKAYRIAPWFILGCKAEVIGQTRDEARSFAWVNAPIPQPRRNQQ